MSLQRGGALLGMREGWPGKEDLDEVVTAVGSLFQPTCSLELTCPSSAIVSWDLEPVLSAFSQLLHTLDKLAGLEGLLCAWRRPDIMRPAPSHAGLSFVACHPPSFLSAVIPAL